MKTRTRLAIGLGFAWCMAASAAEPLTPSRLGVVDAVIASCNDAAGGDDGAYRALKVSLIGKQPDRTLDAMENSAEYRQAFSQVRLALDEVPRNSLRQTCLEAIRGVGRGKDH